MQGVTTVISNNDGGGSVDIGQTLAAWTKQGIGTNGALFIGHGSVRGKVMGAAGALPTAAQLAAMRAIVVKAMDEGAIGMSTGLYYAPGSFSKTDEVIMLAKIVAQKGGIYDTHMRDESSYTIGLIGSVHETVRIAREAKIPVHISHIKALGVDVWGKADSVIRIVRPRAPPDSTSPPISIRTRRRAPESVPRCCRAGSKRAATKPCANGSWIQNFTTRSSPR